MQLYDCILYQSYLHVKSEIAFLQNICCIFAPYMIYSIYGGDIMSITGDRIRERRKQLGISADALANYLGMSRTTIFRYENGDIEKVPANLLSGISKFLNTSEKYLMGWEDNPDKILTKTNPLILSYYEMLNETGKQEATKRIEELTHIPRYKDDIIIAANNSSYTDDTEIENMLSDANTLKK